MVKIRPLIQVLGKIIKLPKNAYLDPNSLGYGTSDSTTVLKGDSSWATPESMGYVPYTGATQGLNLGELGVDAGHIVFDTTPTTVPTDQGTLSWDPNHNTLKIQMNGETGQIMQDTFYFVKNQSGSSIPKGTIVRAAGTLGASGRILIEPFLADGTYPSKYCMGVTAESIPVGGDGMVMHFGQIKQIDLSAYSDGDILYASDTIAGGFTTTRPNAPNNIITIAIVIHAASNGVMQVRPTFSSNINDDEGVNITSPSNGDVLKYNALLGLWENGVSTGSSLPDGDYGDITVGGSGTTMTIDNGAVTEAKLLLSDNTTANVSTSAHGFVPKAPNDIDKILKGNGNWGWNTLLNSSTSSQAANGSDTYINGSSLAIGGKIKAGTVIVMRGVVTKTAAGIATPIFSVRFGTNGTTADTARNTFTGVAQTAATDTGYFEIRLVIRSVSATATVNGVLKFEHFNTTTGLANKAQVQIIQNTSVAFDNTSASLIVGLSVNPGSSGLWTFEQMTAEAFNLA